MDLDEVLDFLVYPCSIAGFQIVNTVPNSTVTLLEATMGSRSRIAAWLFEKNEASANFSQS